MLVLKMLIDTVLKNIGGPEVTCMWGKIRFNKNKHLI